MSEDTRDDISDDDGNIDEISGDISDDIRDSLYGLAYGMLEGNDPDSPYADRATALDAFLSYAEKEIFAFDEGDEMDEAGQRHAFRQVAVAIFSDTWDELRQ